MASAWIAFAQTGGWFEGFEGPQPSWKVLGGNAQYRVEVHERIRAAAHSGEGCERLQLSGTGGSEVYLAHDAGYPQVIPELLPTLWVKADRPGIQFAAQVVLPRSLDPRSQRPLSVLVPGSSYTTVGRWQQLRIEDLPQQLRRQTWSLRSQFGPAVELREAYVERLLLNVYGGPGVTNVWIDDLDIAGHVGTPGKKAEDPGPSSPSSPSAPGGVPGQGGGPAAVGSGGASTPAAPRLRLVDSVLLAEDRPILPRIVEHRGEPLTLLRQLGFNGIWVRQGPSVDLLAECQRVGLWMVCPPPGGPSAEGIEAPDAALPEIGPAFDRVLAWDLGRGLGAEPAQVDAVCRWAQRVRAADRRQPGRPMVLWPETALRPYSRGIPSLFLGLSRAPLGTSLPLSSYAAWLRERPLLAQLGTPVWTTVQTQPAEPLRQQWAALGVSAPPTCAISSELVQSLATTAIVAGSRGLVFESRTPLTAEDAETQARVRTLQLINLQLDVIEPWAAAGHFLATVAGSEPGVVAAELQREHSRLLIPLASGTSTQHVPGQPAFAAVSFVVPGIPETSSAWLMAPGGLQPLWPKRKAGGVQVALEGFDPGSPVLFTSDPKTDQNVRQQLARVGRRIAELQCELAAVELSQASRVAGRLAGRAAAVPETGAWLAAARRDLDQANAFLASRATAEASLWARRAMRPVRLLERTLWDRAVVLLDSPVSSPAAVFFATLPEHWSLMARLAASRPGEPLLAAGSMEDLDQWSQAGWRRLDHPADGVLAGADLSPAAAHTGRFGLRLTVQPGAAKQGPAQLESPPVWMVTPPVPVQPGWIVRIQGWVNVPKPITGSVDGLLIVDSLGGEPLAERIRHTTGWRQFTLYRVATQAETLSVSFALTGFGEAWVDDVSVQPLLPAPDPQPR